MGNEMNRRSFLTTSAVGAVGALLTSIPAIADTQKTNKTKTSAPQKTRVAIVGTGSRGTKMWGKTVLDNYSDLVEYVGLCDKNSGRLQAAKKIMGATCATYTDFETMMTECKPDILIVTTVDATHDQFIISGLNHGCHILTEKPMTTDETKCQAILEAQRKSGKEVIVTFNYRYSPHRAKMWELINSGEIGDVTSVDFHWYLDTSHGADYFRRWHGRRENSGSLWVHKSSHHFDLLGWWLNSEPEEVFAFDSLDFYGKMANNVVQIVDHVLIKTVAIFIGM